ncbi:MAG: phosphatidate cytidylyltransferase [Candidatus Alcyoniella australis]|nr:phosphatidate cytidylyltransferase [Candidatus Alcyoniella australis]
MEHQEPAASPAQWDPKPRRRPTAARGGAKTKIIIGVIGAPLVAWLIIAGPFYLLAVVIALAAILGLLEVGDLLFEPGTPRYKYITLIAGLLIFAAIALGGLILGLLVALAVFALLSALLLREPDLHQMPRALSLIMLGALYAGALPALLLVLKLLEGPTGVLWVFMLFLLVWACDSGAYFSGRALGKRPMAPRISSKKTIEGLLGGMAASLIAGLICGIAFDALHWYDGLLLGLIAAVLGPIGDLVESAFKRAAEVKDSGSLLPGHGGILDRLDAVLFVAPFFLLFIALKFPDAVEGAARLFVLGG